jgi:hypothetical protein
MDMNRQCRYLLVLAAGLFSVNFAIAQDRPADVYPPNYDPAPVESPYPQAPPAQTQPAPSNLTIPAGTLVLVRLSSTLSSDRNNVGDGFTAVLDQPIIAQGWVVSQRGQAAVGRVAVAQKAGRTQGVSQLGVELSELVLVDGQQASVRTQLVQSSAGPSPGRDVAAVGTTTGVGAVIGAVAGGGTGAAIGAAAGAAAGTVGILSMRGRATELYPETLLTFRLQDPVTISTQQSRQAFRPVAPQDYAQNSRRNNAPENYPIVEDYPPPYYYPPYYYSPYWYYGYYGFGPRIYVGPRGYYGGGYYRRRR